MSRMFTIPGTDRRMKTWNVFVGCDFQCSYCSARQLATTRLKKTIRYKDGFKPHLVEKELGRKFKPGDFVFVGYMGDISFADRPIVVDLVGRIVAQSEVNFLFCTKSPLHYWYWHIFWPDNLYLGATIETNRDYKLTRAPAPFDRYKAMRVLVHQKKFISIEPICDFDLEELLSWIGEIGPEIIEVGADNYNNGLPEPGQDKVNYLLSRLRWICPNVVEKKGLERLKGGK